MATENVNDYLRRKAEEAFKERRKTRRKRLANDDLSKDEIEGAIQNEEPQIREEVEAEYQPEVKIREASEKVRLASESTRGFIQIATHIGKYSHPLSKTTIYCKNADPPFGYLCTGGYRTSNVDFRGTSGLRQLADTLLCLCRDRSVLENILDDTGYLEQDLGVDSSEVKKWRENINAGLNADRSREQVDHFLKQIFLHNPSDGSYRTLTPVHDSVLIREANDRMADRRSAAKAADKNSDAFFTAVTRSFGGSNPQNVSALCRGRVRLIKSYPPIFKPYKTPNKDFFSTIPVNRPNENSGADSRPAEICKLFDELHKVYQLGNQHYNQIKMKKLYRQIIGSLILPRVSALQSMESGWSLEQRCQDLPVAQKRWLDPGAFSDPGPETPDPGDWQNFVAGQAAAFIVNTYEKLMRQAKETPVRLDDASRIQIRELFKEYLT